MSRLYNLLDASSPEPPQRPHHTAHRIATTTADASPLRQSRLKCEVLHPTSIVVPPELWLQPVVARLLAVRGSVDDAPAVAAQLAASVALTLHVDVGAHADRDSPSRPRVWAFVTASSGDDGLIASTAGSPTCNAFLVRVASSSPYFAASAIQPLLAGDALVLVAGDASTSVMEERQLALCAAPLFFDMEDVAVNDNGHNGAMGLHDIVRLLSSSLSLTFRWVGPATGADFLRDGDIAAAGAPHARRYFAACVTTSPMPDAAASKGIIAWGGAAAPDWCGTRAQQRRAQFAAAVVWVHGGQAAGGAAAEGDVRNLIAAGFYDLHAFSFADGVWVRRDGLPALSGHALVPLAPAPAALAASGWASDLLTVGGILHAPTGPTPQAFVEVSFLYRAATEAWEVCHGAPASTEDALVSCEAAAAGTEPNVGDADSRVRPPQPQRPQPPPPAHVLAFPQAAAIAADETEMLHQRAAYGEGARIMRRILQDADPVRLSELEAANATASVGLWAFPAPALDDVRTRVLASAADAWSHVVAPTGTGGAGTRDFTLANDRPEMSCSLMRRMAAARAPNVDMRQADAIAAIRRELLADARDRIAAPPSLTSAAQAARRTSESASPTMGLAATPPMLTQHGIVSWPAPVAAQGGAAQYIIAHGGYTRDAATGRVGRSTHLWLGTVLKSGAGAATRWQRLDAPFGLGDEMDHDMAARATKVGPWSAEAAALLRVLPSMAHQLHVAARAADTAASIAEEETMPQVMYFVAPHDDTIIALAAPPAGGDRVMTSALQLSSTTGQWTRPALTQLFASSGSVVAPPTQSSLSRRGSTGAAAAAAAAKQQADPLLAPFQDHLVFEPAVSAATLAVSLKRERQAAAPQAQFLSDGSVPEDSDHPNRGRPGAPDSTRDLHPIPIRGSSPADAVRGAQEPWSHFVQRQREQHAQQLRRQYAAPPAATGGTTGGQDVAAPHSGGDALTRTGSTAATIGAADAITDASAGLADEYNTSEENTSRNRSVGANLPTLHPVRAPPPMPPKLAVGNGGLDSVPPNDMQALARFLFGDAAPKLADMGVQPAMHAAATRPPPENLRNFLFGAPSDSAAAPRAEPQRSGSASTVAPGPASIATAAALTAPFLTASASGSVVVDAVNAENPTMHSGALASSTVANFSHPQHAAPVSHIVTPATAGVRLDYDTAPQGGPAFALEPVVASSPTRLGAQDPSPGVVDGAFRRQQMAGGAAFAAPSLTIYARTPLVVESSTAAPDGIQQFTFRAASPYSATVAP